LIGFYHPSGVCLLPVQVAAQSKAWVCGRSFAGIPGSNPVWGFDVCCHMKGFTTGRSLFQRSPTECDVSECDLQTPTTRKKIGSLGAVG